MNVLVLTHEKMRVRLSVLIEVVMKHVPAAGLVAFTFGDYSEASKLLPSGDFGLVIVGGIVQGASRVIDGKDAIIDLRYKGINTSVMLIADAGKCWYAKNITKVDNVIDQDRLAEELTSLESGGQGPFPEMEKFAEVITFAILQA